MGCVSLCLVGFRVPCLLLMVVVVVVFSMLKVGDGVALSASGAVLPGHSLRINTSCPHLFFEN